MSGPEKTVLLGKIVGVHGVRGELKLESYTEPRTQIFRYQPWKLSLSGSEREVDGCRGRPQRKGLVVELPGVTDRDAAAALVGSEIRVSRTVFPPAAPGEYYWFDLEGLKVRNVQGQPLGTVSHLIATGANDVLVVQDGERERLIPFILERFVTAVDLEGQCLTVDWDADF